MESFNKLYTADIYRYASKPGFYIRIFLFLFRKSNVSNNFFYRKLFVFWASRRGLEISPLHQIGHGLYLGNAYNITINPKATIGANCNIHKGVVIGQSNRGASQGTPTIGNKVWIGINAAIVGNITIGDDVLIAPNAFVNVDVPSHSIVFGNPCIIKHSPNATENYINNILDNIV